MNKLIAKSLIYIAADDATNLISNRNVASNAATISHIHTKELLEEVAKL